MIRLNEVKVLSLMHSCFQLQGRQFYKDRVLGVFSVERPAVLQGQSAWCVFSCKATSSTRTVCLVCFQLQSRQFYKDRVLGVFGVTEKAQALVLRDERVVDWSNSVIFNGASSSPRMQTYCFHHLLS